MPERISCDKERPHNLEKKDNQNIYFTPGIKHNLISVGQFIQNGFKVLMENGHYIIYEKDRTKKLVVVVQITKN